MKGLLFTELMEMVEENFGYNTANAIVQHSKLSTNGVYTAARSYHRNEMSILFQQLHKQTRVSIQKLSIIFGMHLSKRIAFNYPHYFDYINRIFSFISKKESIKRHHDEQLFEFIESSENSLTIIYNPVLKANCISDGIAQGYLEYFNSLNCIQEKTLSNGRIKFIITLRK